MSSREQISQSASALLEQRLKDDESMYTRTTMDDDTESISSLSSRRSTISKYNVNPKSIQVATRTTSFFTNSANQQTLLCVAQAKWAEDKPIPPEKLPLVEELSDYSLANSLVALRAVLPKIDVESCAFAQKRCIHQITDLRKETPTLSGMDFKVNPLASYYCGEMAPLKIESAKIVKSESHLLLERTKAHGFSGKATGVMATFFNPFENKKKQAEKKVAATLLAEGEEREVEIEFSNRLSVPLDIPSCQLVFNNNDSDRIKAPALSFSIPPKAKKFKARFPFVVIKKVGRAENIEEENAATVGLYEVTAIRLTCMSRSFLIPVSNDQGDDEDPLLPIPASVYTRSKHNRPKKNEEEVKPRFEVVPAQPNLHVSFSTSQTAIEDGTTVPVHLSDGEIFTIPSFRLQNDFGPSGLGLMERLQIIGVGMPGIPDEMLFDTDAAAAALEEEDDDDDSAEEEEEDAFEQLMEEDGLPPLKMKAQCESLSIKSINDKSTGEGSRVTFQVAATHDMGNQLANGGNVRIRFRYRGISPNPATEIWRKREVALRIIRVKGPRISSLTFRSDLSWGSSYSELCLSLAEQKVRAQGIARKWGTRQSSVDTDPRRLRFDEEKDDNTGMKSCSDLLTRVGMDPGVHVASDEIVVLMAVANETNSTILLSNRKGRVGGFSGSPMPTVRVTSGVSVKIPVVIPRVARVNLEDPDKAMDIAAELVANTALTWTSVTDGNSASAEEARSKVRQGRVRIPSKCLREIISEHSSFSSRICVPPVSVEVSIGRPEGDAHLSVKRGAPVTAHVTVHIQDWVPAHIRDRLALTMEFSCARKTASATSNGSHGSGKKDYVWCGLLRRTVSPRDAVEGMKHHSRVMFFTEGAFVVSACAKVSATMGVEEIWWAQFAEHVVVS
jgi:Transport protein Trs120 or TRAPPC9, TRAPP II complex subunit